MIDNSPRAKIQSNVKYTPAKVSENTGAIFSILTESVYSMPRIAGIREIISNALDANTRTNSQVPIRITHPSALNPVFCVRDFGPGLTSDDIKDLYTSLGSSSKKEVENEIGFFGIGALSPLAYVEQFTVKSYKDGRLTLYSIFGGEDGVPQVAVINSERTDQHDGLEVSYSIKREEITLFCEDIKYSLSFIKPELFECGLKIEYFKDTLSKVDSLSIKIDDKIFIITNTYKNNGYNNKLLKNMIVMGGVAYDIDYNLVERSNILSNRYVIVEAPLGSVSVQASREKLKMNAKTVAYAKSVLRHIEANIEAEVQKQIDASDNYRDALTIYSRMDIIKLKPMKWRGHNLSMEYLKEQLKKNFTLKFKNKKAFVTYDSDGFNYRAYLTNCPDHQFIIDDVPAGGLTRIADNVPHAYCTVCVELSTEKTKEFADKFGDIFKVKASSLPVKKRTPRKAGEVKEKKDIYKLRKGTSYNPTFVNIAEKFKPDLAKYDGYYVIMKNKSVSHNKMTYTLSDVYYACTPLEKDVIVLDWESEKPPNGIYLFDVLEKEVNGHIEQYWADWIYKELQRNNLHEFLAKERKDYAKGISKFYRKPDTVRIKYMNQVYSSMCSLALKPLDLAQKSSKLLDKIRKSVDKVVEVNYPLISIVNQYHLRDAKFKKPLKEYIEKGDQNVFELCFDE